VQHDAQASGRAQFQAIVGLCADNFVDQVTFDEVKKGGLQASSGEVVNYLT
jgi:hypothetical protein